MHYIVALLDRQSRRSLWIMTLALFSLVATLDHQTGPHFSFHTFYLAPIFIAAWYLAPHGGKLLAGLSVLVWLLSMLASPDRVGTDAQLVWNANMRLIFYLVVVWLCEAFHAALLRERHLARIDPLTGLYNRRHFYELLTSELARCRRYRHALTLAYVDLDDFKTVNDTYGHQAGDLVLTRVAAAIGHLRLTDTAARMGGDEFAILLPETDSPGAEAVMRRLCARLDDALATAPGPVTYSSGVVTYLDGPESIDAVIAEADAYMYRAKASGKARTSYGVIGAT